jgi:hypothetical protein
MANGVRMVGASRFEKLLKVIGRLQLLVLDVALTSSDKFLVRVIGLLVVVALIGAGSDHDSLGLPHWPRLVAFVTPLHALASYLEGRPSTAIRVAFPSRRIKMAPTTLSTEVCLVVMSSISFLVFG